MLSKVARNAKSVVRFVLLVALGFAIGATLCGVALGAADLAIFFVGTVGLLFWLLALGLWAIFYGLGWL